MKNWSVKILIILLVVSSSSLKAKEIYPDFIVDTCLNKQLERVYVHVPQQELIAGQEFYYKANLLSSNRKNTSEISTLLYFDIVNSEGKVISSWKSDLLLFSCSGRQQIPDTIRSGVYFLRAYTSWMLNSGNAFVFQRPLFIANIKEPLTTQIYKPAGTKNYNQPPPDSNVVQLEYSLSKAEAIVTFFIPWPASDLKLSLVFNGLVVQDYSAKKGSNSFKVPLDIKRSGIYHLILTNGSNQMLAQRAIRYKYEKESLNVSFSKKEYAPKEDIEINIGKSSKALQFEEDFSCSVSRDYSLSFLPAFPNMDEYFSFFNFLPVDAWLTGRDDYGASMNWNETIWGISSEELTEECRYIRERGAMLLAGKILLKNSQLPVQKGVVSLSISNAVPQVKLARTNSNGEFYFWLDKTCQNQQLHVKIESDSISNDDVIISFSQLVPETLNLEGEVENLSDGDREMIKELKQVYLVNSYYEQISSSNTNNETEINLESFIQYPPDYTQIPGEYNGLKDFSDIVKNILPLVGLKRVNTLLILEVYDSDHNETLQNPLVLVDGIPFSDITMLSQFKAEEFKKISVYRTKLFYGTFAFPGIILIETHPGSDAEIEAKKNSVILENNFVANRNYEIINQEAADNRPNFSNLLYWNPNLDLSSDKQLKLNAPDLPGRYQLVIEGFTTDGEPVSISKYFIVKE